MPIMLHAQVPPIPGDSTADCSPLSAPDSPLSQTGRPRLPCRCTVQPNFMRDARSEQYTGIDEVSRLCLPHGIPMQSPLLLKSEEQTLG